MKQDDGPSFYADQSVEPVGNGSLQLVLLATGPKAKHMQLRLSIFDIRGPLMYAPSGCERVPFASLFTMSPSVGIASGERILPDCQACRGWPEGKSRREKVDQVHRQILLI